MSETVFYNSKNLVGVGSVGVGTTSPYSTFDLYGSQITRNPSVYNSAAGGWYNIGLWDAGVGAGGNVGQRLRLELIGGGGYDNSTATQSGGVTTIYATIGNNFTAGQANIRGSWKHDGGQSVITTCKFVQNSTNRNQYYVYVNMNSYTQHGIRVETTQGSAFTPSFTSTTDPGVDSSTVRAAPFSMITGYDAVGYVGIGTTNPQSNLHVYATVGGAGLTIGPTAPYTAAAGMFGLAILNDGLTSGQYAAIQIGKSGTSSSFMSYNYTGSAANDYLSFTQYGSASGSALVVRGNNNVGIGTTSPSRALHVSVPKDASTGAGPCVIDCTTSSGFADTAFLVRVTQTQASTYNLATFQANGGSDLRCNIRGDGLIYSAYLTGTTTTLSVDGSGNIIRTPSDARLKTNVASIAYGLDVVNAFRPVSYEWIDGKYGTGRSIGLIAQEVAEIVPEAVGAANDEDKTLSLDYQKLVPVLTKAIQELSAENTTLKTRLDSLEARLAAAGL